MIKVGANEPVLLSKVEKNDKGTLSISFTEKAAETKAKVSLIDQMNEASDTSGSSSGTMSMLLFPPSREIKGKDGLEKVKPERLIDNLMALKNQCSHILNKYKGTGKIEWNVFRNAGVIKTEEDILKAVQDEVKFKQMYANIVDQFIEQAIKFKAVESGKPMRLFLVRQSKEKHFGRLRDKFLDEQPFLEDASIPKAESKLYVKAGTKGATTFFEPTEDGYLPKFTAYEIKNGLDNPIVSATTSDSNEATPEDTAAVENLFGQQPEAPVDFTSTPEIEPEAAPEDGIIFGKEEE